MNHLDCVIIGYNEVPFQRYSEWLPQWSFDFWIIPYQLGKEITLDQFKDFMTAANKLLALDIAYVPPAEKEAKRKQYLQEAIEASAGRRQVA